ncbi:MAG: ATP-binding protein [Eubacterium sp.]|nr:ATP-binding protein [Eubacterium sp.]
MAYSKEMYIKAERILENRKKTAESEALLRSEEIKAKIPELAKIQSELAKIGIEISRLLFYKDNAPQRLEELKSKSLALIEKRNKLLNENGLDENVLKPDYTCAACEDKGFIENRMCSCMKQVLKDLMRKEISKLAPIDSCTFDNFDTSLYDNTTLENGINPREKAERALGASRKYAQNFSRESKNLLFLGATGLGKTHLSLAIANVVINRAYSVCYGTSYNICEDLRNESFGRTDYITYTKNKVLDADLLILDDLGTETDNQYNTASISNIINSRMLSGKPTVISTNYEYDELLEKYDQRVASRLTGEYITITLFGKDIRNK